VNHPLRSPKRGLATFLTATILALGFGAAPARSEASASTPACYTISATTITGLGSCVGPVVIGSEISSIADGAFDPFRNLDSQGQVPRGITSVDMSASTLTSLGDHVFSNSQNLTTVLLPPNLISIGSSAFAGDSNVHSITFPNTLISIGQCALCMAPLAEIVIPDSVIEIGDSAFIGNSALTTLSIGSGLETITANTFPSSFMGVVTVNSGNTHFTSIDGHLYSFDGQIKFTGIAVENLSRPEVKGDSKQGDGMQGNSQQGVAMQGDGRTFAGEQGPGGLSNGDSLTGSGCGEASILSCSGPSATISSDMEHPEIQIATIPSGVFVARIPATSNLPATTLNFSENAPAQVTVAPVALPASELAPPFTISRSTKIVDIQISGTFSGTATVCLDGASTDHLFHFTGTPAAWIELPSRAYVNGQVCGITDNFSPFTAAPPIAAAITAAPDPVQQSMIASLSISTAVAQTSAPVLILGTFVEKVAAIHISGTPLSTNSWIQTPTSISFTMPAQIKGVYQIQIYNGSAPVLDVQTFTFIGSEIQVSPKPGPIVKPKVTYIRCVKPGRGTRIAYGINPSCPVGYVKK